MQTKLALLLSVLQQWGTVVVGGGCTLKKPVPDGVASTRSQQI